MQSHMMYTSCPELSYQFFLEACLSYSVQIYGPQFGQVTMTSYQQIERMKRINNYVITIIICYYQYQYVISITKLVIIIYQVK